MNNLVELEYDSFENEKFVKLKDLVHASIIENTLKLDSQEVIVSFSALQEGMEEPKYFLWVNCANIQETLIKLNGEKTINKNQVCAEKNHSFCEITNEDLKMICDAHMVEIRVKNGDGHIDFTSEEILIGARAIYNAVVDENTYIDDIQRVEKERTERQQKLEREKLSEIEKFNQRIERIKQKGVNKYFSLNYDKFKQKLTVDIKEAVEFKQIEGSLLILEPKIGFRFVYTNEESSVLMIDFEAVSKRGLNLKNGELLFLLDQTKRLSLQPHESYSDPYLQEYHIESDWYEITADELKSLCEARVIEMRITNGNEYHDLTTEGIQLAARRFYNAVIDDTAYTDDLLTQEEREIAEQERIRKEREAQEAEEARIRAEKRAAWWAANKKKVWISVSIVVAIIIAIFVVIIISDVKKSERQRIETAIRERNLHSEQWKNDRISKIKQLTVNKLFKCTQPYSNQLLYELYVDKDENNRWITTGRTLALMIEIDKDFTTSVTILLRKGTNQDLDKILNQYKNLGTGVFANIPFKYSYSISEEQIANEIRSYMEILAQVRKNYAEQTRMEREINFVNGFRAVDMGVSVRWADCNVGAGSPDDIGHYYAWGEIYPKTSYNSQTYKYYSNSTWVLKYCTMSDYGNVDNKLILEPQDDAATVNLGEGWSTPTKEQWEELANSSKCTWEWITTMRVPGYRVTSKITGNSIFIPTTGYLTPAGYQHGEMGLYWTSSLYPNIWKKSYGAAYRFDMRQTSFDIGRDSRENGRPIRAVYKGQSKNHMWVRLSDIPNNKESYKFRKIRLHFDRYTIDRYCYCHIKYADNNQFALEFCFTSSGDYIINHQGKNYQITNKGEYIGNNTYEYDLNNLCGTIDKLFYFSFWEENFLPEQVEIYTEQVRIQREAEERDRAISKADGYVDLGLPSGTLWKTENEDCGLVTYDKAYELYGNSLPTYEQLKELNDKCQWIWKGNGYKIIGKNGETIFMPAAGYRPCDGPMKLVGSYGYCWASTPVGSEKAWRLGFCSNNVFLNPLYRCYSFSVRLVR